MNRWLFLQNTSYYFIFPHKTATQFFSYFSNNSHNAYKNVGAYSKFNITKLSVWKLIKSILIHEYQHESTRINTGQHESDTSQHESTQINTSPTRVNTSPTRVNTNQHESTRVNTTATRVNTKQHESKTGLDHEKETNMVKRKDKTWLNGLVEDCIYQDLGFFLKFMTNWTIKHYFFIKVFIL